MANLNMSMNHRLSQDEALRRIKTLLDDVQKQYADKITNLKESWTGPIGKFSFSAMGFNVSGTLVVKPATVELAGDLPFAAKFFKGRIESTIRTRATELLA